MPRRRVSSLARIALASTLVAVAPALPAIGGEAHAEVRILLLGNSFTRGLKPILRSLARAAGHDAVIVARALSGWTLADHASSASTLARLRSRPWTHVVLQEQSAGMFGSRRDDAAALDAEAVAIGAETVLLMTWRDRDAPLSAWDSLRGAPGDDVGYVPVAFALGASVAPAGWCLREAVLDDPSAELWGRDGHHASGRGRALAAMALFAAIYGESPSGLDHPRHEEAAADQDLVAEVVLADPSQWNIDAPPGGHTLP